MNDPCAESKQAELDKANARIAQLEDSVKSSLIELESLWIEDNEEWARYIAGKRHLTKSITNSSNTWLLEHDKAVEVAAFRKIIETESDSGWRGVLDLIESRK